VGYNNARPVADNAWPGVVGLRPGVLVAQRRGHESRAIVQLLGARVGSTAAARRNRMLRFRLRPSIQAIAKRGTRQISDDLTNHHLRRGACITIQALARGFITRLPQRSSRASPRLFVMNPDESFFLGTMMALRIVPTASRCAGYN